MRTGHGTLLAWAILLAALTGLQFVFMVSHVSYGLLGGAAVLVAALGLVARGRRGESELRSVPDLSYPALLAAVGAAGAAVGAAFGPLFYFPGLGLLALGLGGIARELRAERGVKR